jgi:hypothetical protein
MNYQITPISQKFILKTRTYGLDDQNQTVIKQIAQGGEPCRDVLRRAVQGEQLILASYCPFEQEGPYKEYGAIFILANQSNELINHDRLTSLINNNYLINTFVLKAYDENEFITDARLVTADNAEQTIEEFFTSDSVKFIVARFAAYGCYSLRLDREQ